MDTSVSERTLIKLFVGTLMTPSLKQHIYDSESWKEAMIRWQSEPEGIREITYEKKKYIGFYVKDHSITMDELIKKEKELRNLLKLHCPLIDEETIKLKIFPQLFVA